jgi:hypothetical protein
MSPKSEPCRILAVGAHPDDVEFACGGVLLTEAARGSELFLCVCSRGESGTNGTPEEREAEARHAAEPLPARLILRPRRRPYRCFCLNAPEIARRIRVIRPDIRLAGHPLISTLITQSSAISAGTLRD